MPSQPQFVTETSIINSKDYVIEWGHFSGATSYHLLGNGDVIYSGDSTSFLIENQPDGIYQYQLIANLFSGSDVASEVITIDVDFKVPTPELNLPYSQTIETTGTLYIEWTKTIDADWYALQHTSPDGKVTEVYNGSDNFFTFSGLEEGQNRFRANLGFEDGKFSELSNSSYVNYLPQEEKDSSALNFVSFFSTVVIILLAVRVRKG